MQDFIERWNGRVAGAERGTACLYLNELTAALGLDSPDPSNNDYAFERPVRSSVDEGGQPKRIDLYKRDCFILEAKQSRRDGDGRSASVNPFEGRLKAANALATSVDRRWEALMRGARKQAQTYVSLLPADHATPPFLIVCDVARGFEVWADFTGTGRGYAPFPDRDRYRFSHSDLARPEIQARLVAIWTKPGSLDPSREAAQVTREIVDDLVAISRRLEGDGHHPKDVAQFLMRCIFTMFAADAGLFSKSDLVVLIKDCIQSPRRFTSMMWDFWRCFDQREKTERYFGAFGYELPHIDSGLFKDREALPLQVDELRLLLKAAQRQWRDVEPAIFGALLEHALSPEERRRRGAHYTPRRYVETVVEQTVMEPLWTDWHAASSKIEKAREAGDNARALRLAKRFQSDLCKVRVLDPACGTGNFLYVSLDRMKRLEAEVLETLDQLEDGHGHRSPTIDPRQFFGLDVDPWAVAIAKLMLWIGWLQHHDRTHADPPDPTALGSQANIFYQDAILAWDGAPIARSRYSAGGPIPDWPNLRRPDWPEADFIVGNPPFIGGKDLRARLAEGYADALRSVNPQMNASADLVMYWWDRAAEILTTQGARLRRFGFVTTNSITQVFQRRTLDRWLTGDPALSLVHATPDHPWIHGAGDCADVRIAITVAEAGRRDGQLSTVVAEAGLDTDRPDVTTTTAHGRINADLTLGVTAASAQPLRANDGLCSPGVKLHGSGFIVSRAKAIDLGLERRPGLDRHIRPYRNGRDLTARSRNAFVIDLHGLQREEVRERFPEVYIHLSETVRNSRRRQAETSSTADARIYADQWWVFGKPRPELRAALAGLRRYIATVETAKHRVFQFLDAEILPDNMLVCVADDDAATLAILSSRAQAIWCRASGGRLEDRPRYTKTACFDSFPFPALDEAMRERLRAAGEKLDSHRREVLEDLPDLTLTGLYNLLAAVRADQPLSDNEREMARRAQIVILRELHDEIDQLTAEAYGWPNAQTDAEMLAALIDINRARDAEERLGRLRWLRPDYQTGHVGLPRRPARRGGSEATDRKPRRPRSTPPRSGYG